MPRTVAAIASVLLVTACSALADDTDSIEGAASASCVSEDALSKGSFDDAVTTWLKSSATILDDEKKMLERVEQIVGDAKIAAFGEPDHGLHDFPALRNKMFRMLVEKKGFRAITLESGIVEARLVDRYVTDTDGTSGVTLEQALAEGVTHGMGEWDETVELLDWMRTYNKSAKTSGGPMIRFGGKDLSVRGDTLSVPLDHLVPIFQKAPEKLRRFAELAKKASELTLFVEETTVTATKGKLKHIDPDHLDAVASLSYDQLSAAEQDELRGEIAKLEADLANRDAWVAAVGEDLHGWAQTLVLVAKQIQEDLDHRARLGVIYGPTNSAGGSFEYLEQVFAFAGRPMPAMRAVKFLRGTPESPPVYTPEQLKLYGEGRAIREVHLADNVMALEKRFGKTFNFAASSHVQRAPMLEDGGNAAAEGQFIAAKYKKGYVVIGGSASEIEVPAPSGKPGDERRDAFLISIKKLREEQMMRAGVFERRFEGHGASGLLVDLRKDPACSRPRWVNDWLSAPQLVWVGTTKFDAVPSKNFDAFLWLRKATLGHPFTPTRK